MLSQITEKKKAKKKKGKKAFEPPTALPDLAPYDNFVPIKDLEPLDTLPITNYDSVPLLLSLSNRTATDVERKHILKIIRRQELSLNQLEDSIKAGTITRDESQAIVDSIRGSLMVARSHRVIIQRRLDSHTRLEDEASLTEQLVGQEKDGGDDIYLEVLKDFEAELAIVRQTIEKDIQGLSQITIRIQDLEKDLVEASLMLQLESDSLKSSLRCQALIRDTIGRYEALFRRGRDLPNELLIKIFGFAADSDIDLIRSNPDKPRTFVVFRLSSICKHWRHVVRQIPYLWRYIPLPSSCDVKLLEVFRLYAKNSVGAPHITIHFSSKKPESAEVVAPGGFGGPVVVGGLANLISTSAAALPDILGYYLNTTIPQVTETLSKTLSIEFIRRGSFKETSEVDCNWRITSYTLRGFIPNFTQGAATHINKLIIHTGDISDDQVRRLHSTLRTLPKLHYLGIHVGRFNAQGNWGGVINLDSLEIVSTQLNFVAELFGALIVAPKLGRLHIIGSYGDEIHSEAWQRVVSQASLGTIRMAVLDNSTSSVSPVAGLLSVLEDLVGVEELGLVGNFLSTILSNLSTRFLLSPALRTLVIRDSDIDGLILKQLLQSRRHTIERQAIGKSVISKVELDGSSRIDLACCEEIGEMVETLLVTDRCRFTH